MRFTSPRAERWRKVLIVGGPGSGKTTLAAYLAERLDCPCYELDVIGYEGGSGPERPMADRLREVADIAASETWVADGTFMGWTDALAATADVIIWLDVPWPVACYRLVSRHAKASLARRNKHRGLRKLWHFVRLSKKYYTATEPGEGRHKTADWLSGFDANVVTCRTAREVEDLVDSRHFAAGLDS